MQVMVSHAQRSKLLEVALAAGVTMLDALDGLLRSIYGLDRRTYTRRAPRARAQVSRPLVAVDDETIREALVVHYLRRDKGAIEAELRALGVDDVEGRDAMARRLADEHIAGTPAVMAARLRGDVHGAAALVRSVIDDVCRKRDAAQRWKDMIHG